MRHWSSYHHHIECSVNYLILHLSKRGLSPPPEQQLPQSASTARKMSHFVAFSCLSGNCYPLFLIKNGPPTAANALTSSNFLEPSASWQILSFLSLPFLLICLPLLVAAAFAGALSTDSISQWVRATVAHCPLTAHAVSWMERVCRRRRCHCSSLPLISLQLSQSADFECRGRVCAKLPSVPSPWNLHIILPALVCQSCFTFASVHKVAKFV